MPIVTLKPGHVRPVWSGHPWVFAQAIARIEGGAVAGDEVTVVDPHGTVLGRGLYTPRSAIPVRLFTRDDTPIDGAVFRKRIERARDSFVARCGTMPTGCFPTCPVIPGQVSSSSMFGSAG